MDRIRVHVPLYEGWMCSGPKSSMVEYRLEKVDPGTVKGDIIKLRLESVI